MTEFKQILDKCWVSLNGASRLLDVRLSSIKNWYYGACNPPQGVMDDFKKYAKQAEKIFK